MKISVKMTNLLMIRLDMVELIRGLVELVDRTPEGQWYTQMNEVITFKIKKKY